MTSHHLLLTLVAIIACLPLGAQCGNPGQQGVPQISLTSTVTGRSTEFQISQGAPGAHWICLSDITTGPTFFPFGDLCTGAAPVILFNSLNGSVPRLDLNGAATVQVEIPTSFGIAEGTPFFLQSIVLDPVATAGLSLSNSETIEFRRPRVFVGSDSFGAVNYFTSIEPASGVIDYSVDTTFEGAADLIHAPAVGRLIIENNFGDVCIADDVNGNVLFTTNAGLPSAPGGIALANDGRTLLVVRTPRPGSLFVPAIPGFFRTVDLETGATSSFGLTNGGSVIIPHPTRSVGDIAKSCGSLNHAATLAPSLN